MKTVLLTGSSGGLGINLATALISKNYFVILHYKNHKEEVFKLHELYKEQTFLIQGDIKKEDDVIKMKKTLEKNKIKIDILINNAGIDLPSELEEKKEETFIEIFKVNTLGAFYMIKHFGNEVDSRKGSIINISSDNTIDMYDIVSLEYDISKSGLNIMTKTFAKYFTNAKVNAIAFGWLDTKMNDIPENIKKNISFVPFKKATDKIIEMIETEKTGEIELVR